MQWALGWIPLTAFALSFTRLPQFLENAMVFTVRPIYSQGLSFQILTLIEAILLTILAASELEKNPSNNVAHPQSTFVNESVVVSVYIVSICLFAIRVVNKIPPGPLDVGFFGLYITLALRSNDKSTRNLAWVLLTISAIRLASYVRGSFADVQGFSDTFFKSLK